MYEEEGGRRMGRLRVVRVLFGMIWWGCAIYDYEDAFYDVPYTDLTTSTRYNTRQKGRRCFGTVLSEGD